MSVQRIRCTCNIVYNSTNIYLSSMVSNKVLTFLKVKDHKILKLSDSTNISNYPETQITVDQPLNFFLFAHFGNLHLPDLRGAFARVFIRGMSRQ